MNPQFSSHESDMEVPAIIQARAQMLETIRSLGVRDAKVLSAMGKIPRQLFVPENLRDLAYDDGPLSIGSGQTISQPYMVAIMTKSLGLAGSEKLLEIGTGSGYQTAILAELAAQIYTLDRVDSLLLQAQERLLAMGYENIHFRAGDGTLGWPEEAPFNAILVTAAAPGVAPPWKEQLVEGGRLVVPVGPRTGQTLMKYTKHGDNLEEEAICGCVFVPLLGEYGWKEGEF